MAEAANRPNDRLYMELARKLVAELVADKYPVGSRLPAERVLAAQYGVSRPTLREAIIALEVRGFVEVRTGSGIYVVRHPGDEDVPDHGMTALELTEARLLIEGETAALAASQITDEQIGEIAGTIDELAAGQLDHKAAEQFDRRFHLAIAKATGNGGLLGAVTRLWNLRETAAEAALLYERARPDNAPAVVDEHTQILDALKARDPVAARGAMHAHLTSVLDSLLVAAEEQAVEEARRTVRAKRDRYTPAAP